MTKRMLLLLMAALAMFAVACGDDDDDEAVDDDATIIATDTGDGGGSAGETVEVTATDFALAPSEIEVAPGDEVTISLVNDGDATHNFTIDELSFEVEADAGESADEDSFIAPDETVEFYCSIHPTQMRGTLKVEGSVSGGSSGGGGAGY